MTRTTAGLGLLLLLVAAVVYLATRSAPEGGVCIRSAQCVGFDPTAPAGAALNMSCSAFKCQRADRKCAGAWAGTPVRFGGLLGQAAEAVSCPRSGEWVTSA